MKPSRARPHPSSRQYRGPFRAEVLEVIDADTVLVRATPARAAEVLRAEVAVIGYAPLAGDRVVVEAGDDGAFVTGALGEARRRLHVAEGDLTLSAGGRIVLRAAEVVTQAGRLEVEAERIVERAGDHYLHVEGLAEVQAGRARSLIAGEHQLAAKRTTIQSDEDTIVDGRRVLLG